jgi:hypothetical protein
MANQSLGIGAAADDGTGDTLRIAADKVNDNFLEIYTLIGDASQLTSGISATATVVTLTAALATTSFSPSSSDGAALGTTALEWSDLYLADAAVVGFGDDQDVTLTHVADTGLLLNSTMKIQFNDDSQFIHGSSATVLSIGATDEIDLTATAIDINGTADISGTLGVTGVATFAARDIHSSGITIANAGQIGSVGDADAIAIASDGVVTMTQIPVFSAGLNVSGGTIAGTLSTAAQTNITSLGTLTALVVDDVSINGKVMVMTGDTDDTVTFTTAANGTLSIVTVDTAGAAGNIQVTADGTVDIDSAGVLTLDSGAAINIEPASGSAILLDGTISIDAGVVTGATSITSTAFVGDITGDVTGNADTATALETARTIGGTSFDGSANIAVALASVGTAVTVADESSDTTCFPLFATAATGDLPPKSGTNLTFNSSSGLLTATLLAGDLTGDVTGTADVATVATTVTITDNESTNESNALIFTAGGDVDGGNLGLESDGTLTYNPSTGIVTATGFAGALTGNVTGNASGTAATVTGAAQTNITSVGTLTALQVDNININLNTISTTAGTDLLITPVAGQQIVLDGTIIIDAGVVTGATSITSTAFVGDITGDVTGTADAATAVTVADESSDTTCFPLFATAATGDLPPKSGTNLTFNSSSGLLTATLLAGDLTGDVTGTADTATVATTVTITDNESTNEDNAIIFTAGGDVDGGNIGLESDGTLTYNPSTGKITATGFIGALTGNVTGNLAGTVSTATQNSITTATGLVSVGALDSGSITSGFTSIDVGAGAISTTGAVTYGSLNDGTTALGATAAELNILDASAGNVAAASDVATSAGAVTSNNAKISHTITLNANLADDAIHADIVVTSDKCLATSVVMASSSLAVGINIHTIAAGSFKVSITNLTGAQMDDDSTLVVNYRII